MTTSIATRAATTLTLMACLTGWFLLPYTPAFLPGERMPGHLALLMQWFTWWPLALLVAFVLGFVIQKLQPASGIRNTLVLAQWLLTLGSFALVLLGLYYTFLPRAG